MAIALTDDGTIQQLSRAAERARDQGRRKLGTLEGPWPNFVDSVRAEIDKIVVSHRVSKKVSGALHEDTFYAPPEEPTRAALPPRVRRVIDARVPGKMLSKGEVKDITDERIRQLVIEKLQAAGTDDPRKAFVNPANLPFLPRNDGPPMPIKRVRINIRKPVFAIGKGRSTRHVLTESNHHVESIATVEDGNEVDWQGRVVPMKDAYQRMKSKLPVVNKTCERGEEYKFSLSPGDVVECDDEKGTARLLVYKGVSQYTACPVPLSLLPVNDARKNPKLIRVVPNTLRKWHARKVVVTPLGEVSESHE